MVTSIDLKQLKTGTAPWDDNDEAGNDTSSDNLIVCSFDQVTWNVENTMEIKSGAERYTGGKIYFEVTVPEGFTSETVDGKTMSYEESEFEGYEKYLDDYICKNNINKGFKLI